MATQIDPTAAVFYASPDLTGTATPYAIGADISLPTSLNDKFQSVNVGASAKVIAWQHYDESGIYQEWAAGEHPDISSIGGLSRFKVVEGNTRAVAFAFKDATGGKKRQYSLKVEARDVGTVTLYSGEEGEGEGTEYRLVGIMPEGGPPVTTALYVRDESSGAYVALGSVYFQWSEKEDRVEIVENENWPAQLKQERTGASTFVLTLVDSTPSS
ncbi:hypothetical protein VTI74DRAFT_4729 [Chaetomium olivicolor]